MKVKCQGSAWEQRYAELVAELGEPEHPEFVSYHQSWVESTGPKSAEELQAMSIGEIVRLNGTTACGSTSASIPSTVRLAISASMPPHLTGRGLISASSQTEAMKTE
jgi:hypothetical protein